MKRLLTWREGALARIRGESFAMNPYAPPPKPSIGDLCLYGMRKGLDWARGYWWAHDRANLREDKAKPEDF